MSTSWARMLDAMYTIEEIRPGGPSVWRREDANRHFGAPQVRRMVASGRWQVPHRNTVVCHNGPLAEPEQLRSALLACPPGSALGGWSALAFDGFSDRHQHRPTVILPAGARRPALAGVDLSYTAHLGPDDVDPRSEPRRTLPARSLVDAARWSPTGASARVVLLRGLQARIVTPAALGEALEHRGRCRHLGLMRETLADAAGGAASVPEIEFARLVRRLGLPEPERQFLRRRPDGRYYLDAAWPALRFSVEVEGTHHSAPGQRDRDWDRHNELTVDGWRVLHVSSYSVRHEPERVSALLLRVFAKTST